MAQDIFREGEPLTAEGLFQMVTDEVLRDGKVEPSERNTVLALATRLKLDSIKALAIFDLSKKKLRDGTLGDARPMDRTALYGAVLRYIFSDRRYDQDEEELFSDLRAIFGLTDAEYVTLMQQAFPRPVRP
jgi:hypothetical protein